MEFTEEQINIKEKVETYARDNKKHIARELTDTNKFPSEDNPVSVFMAGSPGAGKTESSINLIKKFSREDDSVLRIDSDELRSCFVEYNGINSSLFQGATSILASKMQDMALDNKQSFIFDGTLAKIDKAKENISRSIGRGRFVQILYVYQDPIQAWEFVKKRELQDGRHVPKQDFIDQYFAARETVNELKAFFGGQIKVDLLVKNIDGSDQYFRENIDIIDKYVIEKYTRDNLNDMLL